MALRIVTLLLAYVLSSAAGAAGAIREAGALPGTHGAERARRHDVLAWVKTVRDRKDAARACRDDEVALPDRAMPPPGLPDSLRRSELLAGICREGDVRPGPQDIADE